MNKYFDKNIAISFVIACGLIIFCLYKYEDAKYPFNKSNEVSESEYNSTRKYLLRLSKTYGISYEQINVWIKEYSNYMLLEDAEVVLKAMKNANLPMTQENFKKISETLYLIRLEVDKEQMKIIRDSYGF